MNQAAMRARYISASVATMTPAKLLLALYDRLVLDCLQAEAALREGQLDIVNARLRHAQEILVELQSSLRFDVWPAGRGLASLYVFLRRELVAANTTKDAKRIAVARGHIEQLLDAWRQAAAKVGP